MPIRTDPIGQWLRIPSMTDEGWTWAEQAAADGRPAPRLGLVSESAEPEAAGSEPTANALSSEELLMAVAAGDRSAFAQLYDRLAPRVFGLVRHLLRDAAQAEEVTQEVFVELWQTAPRFDASRGTVVTWALTLSHRRAVDRVRAAQASRERDLRVGARDWMPDHDSVAEQVELRLEGERVQAALARLTELQRQAVTLAYYRGYSHTEVAELLAVPLGTVKTRIRDGMIRLRDELGVAS